MQEGLLVLNTDGRFTVNDITLHCGTPIELYVENYGWIKGRVEHSEDYRGYYFFNTNGRHRSLWEGLKVRI